MTQPPTPQTKFNAKRSAENATRRTGIEHSIAEVEGGWMVVAPQSVAENEPPAAEIDETTQAEASAIADEIDAGQVKPPGSPPCVPRGLAAAARAVLDAWNDETNREIDIIGALEEPMAALSIALAGKPGRPAGAPRPPRVGTKQQAVHRWTTTSSGPARPASGPSRPCAPRRGRVRAASGSRRARAPAAAWPRRSGCG